MTNLKKRMVGCLHFTVCCIIVFFAIVCCLKSLIAAIFRSLLALPDLQAEGPVEMVQASQQVTICPFFNLQSDHQALDGPILLPMLCHSLA
jgi:hypothetical protein